jgi:hypothetical protein
MSDQRARAPGHQKPEQPPPKHESTQVEPIIATSLFQAVELVGAGHWQDELPLITDDLRRIG